MALNPFFLQGSPGEQRLIQELINEQLKIYGVEVTYIPRKFVRKNTILKEVQSSKFNDNFLLESYVNNYEGYTGAGDILSKFGMSLKDNVNLIISKERFEDFISPFLDSMDDSEIELATRPREGDMIYFPLGQRLFEVKFVEHEKPFYQLGKLYVYELQCELFEYEDEVLDTTIDEIDEIIKDQGYITSLQLFSGGTRAYASSDTVSGYVRRVIMTNDGYDYTEVPSVEFTEAPIGGLTASAVAITTSKGSSYSVKEILLVNPGYGYTQTPTVTIISSGKGVGAAATCELVTGYNGVGSVGVGTSGSGYATPPLVSFSSPSVGLAITAMGKSIINSSGNVTQILIRDAGIGYASSPTITIDSPTSLSGIGTYKFNEIVTGSVSGTTARVKSWNKTTNILEVSINNGQFYPGELVVGESSSASYAIKIHDMNSVHDKYEENTQIETEADFIIDFSESNPFGKY